MRCWADGATALFISPAPLRCCLVVAEDGSPPAWLSLALARSTDGDDGSVAVGGRAGDDDEEASLWKLMGGLECRQIETRAGSDRARDRAR